MLCTRRCLTMSRNPPGEDEQSEQPFVGADWERQGAFNGAQRRATSLTRSHRHTVTCGFSCLCWSRSLPDVR